MSEADPAGIAADVFRRVFAALRLGTAAPTVQVRYRPFANARSSIRLQGGGLEVQISDILANAPPSVLEALAHILLAKLYRRRVSPSHVRGYRQYLNTAEIRQTVQNVRAARGRKLMGPAKGGHYDLELIFNELNFAYFFGLMARPDLGWSVRSSRSTLGHYDWSHNAIVINKLLDSGSVPRLALEYVMFHEMLHVRYPVEHAGLRRRIHTPQFKEAERKFSGYQEAKKLLRSLSRR